MENEKKAKDETITINKKLFDEKYHKMMGDRPLKRINFVLSVDSQKYLKFLKDIGRVKSMSAGVDMMIQMHKNKFFHTLK